MKKEDIENILQGLRSVIEEKKVVSSHYAMIRLLLLILGLVCVYYGYHDGLLFYALLLVDIAIFLWFATLHRKIKETITIQMEVMDSYQDIRKRTCEEWKQFEDTGSDFLNEHTTQAYDLDIFGHASLFQYLSCAKTVLGREELAHMLSCQMQTKDTIVERQQAIAEMSDKESFAIYFTALLKQFQKHARKKKKQTLETFFVYMEGNVRIYPTIFRFLIILLSLSTTASILYAILLHGSIVFFSIFGVSGICIAMLSVLKNASSFREVNIMENTLRDYQYMFEHISKQPFQSKLLQQYSHQLQDASQALRKLNVIVNFIRLRNDGITFLIFNFLFSIDFLCVFALEAWKKQYGKQIRTWYSALAKFEAMLSLSQVANAKEHVCVPTIASTPQPHLEVIHLRHPLLCEEVAVSNTFCAHNETYIITGSNMSGKTTFLRTLGLNIVLFHAGALVCGQQFHATSMNLFTSMRIKDDVSEGISTFYAEILRIKEMIEISKQQQPMVVLIDEIFKGTNSSDRIVCAKEVLKQLHVPHVLSLVSTHDFELCDLQFENQKRAHNYHFSEYYEANAICFDYTLKTGKCKTTNAKELLKLAGIAIDTRL